MQKISFGDREYVKASEAAKRFKYTQDYIGQLCRGDKVDARLVGRVWYVNLDSITEYRKTKHATQKKVSKNAQTAKATPKKRPVEPVVRAKTARKIQEAFPRDAIQATRHLLATYSRDKTANIPVLNSVAAEQSEETKPVVATKKDTPRVVIKVRPNTKKPTKYTTEKLPEITLKSRLKVSGDIKNLVPESVDVYQAAAAPAVVGDSNITIKVTKASARPTQPPVNFHPQAVSVQKQPTEHKRTERKTRVSKKPLVLVLLGVGYVTSLLLAVCLVLGFAYYSDVASSMTTSGVWFSAEIALEKILQILR